MNDNWNSKEFILCEFACRCGKRLKRFENELKELIDDVLISNISIRDKSILVTSNLNTFELQQLLEKVLDESIGLVGIGEVDSHLSQTQYQSAVSIIEADEKDRFPVDMRWIHNEEIKNKINHICGVIRFVQLSERKCLAELTIDNLEKNKEYHINFHEFGDISDGCKSCGEYFLLNNNSSLLATFQTKDTQKFTKRVLGNELVVGLLPDLLEFLQILNESVHVMESLYGTNVMYLLPAIVVNYVEIYYGKECLIMRCMEKEWEEFKYSIDDNCEFASNFLIQETSTFHDICHSEFQSIQGAKYEFIYHRNCYTYRCISFPKETEAVLQTFDSCRLTIRQAKVVHNPCQLVQLYNYNLKHFTMPLYVDAFVISKKIERPTNLNTKFQKIVYNNNKTENVQKHRKLDQKMLAIAAEYDIKSNDDKFISHTVSFQRKNYTGITFKKYGVKKNKHGYVVLCGDENYDGNLGIGDIMKKKAKSIRKYFQRFWGRKKETAVEILFIVISVVVVIIVMFIVRRLVKKKKKHTVTSHRALRRRREGSIGAVMDPDDYEYTYAEP
ncbi:hypothetical protein SNEBB_010492 [Seison nebaliae]|nr:hypothetical protein SNEBB_010492 [Seison nebaliae]